MDVKRPVRPEWHPGIKALAWVFDWETFAFSTGLVIEALVMNRSGFVAPLRPLARSAVVFAAVGFLVFLIFAGENWWQIVRYGRRQVKPRFVLRFILIASAVTGLGLALYTSLAVWLLRGAWRILEPLSLSLTFSNLKPSAHAGWKATLVLLAAGALMASFMVVVVYILVRNYVNCVRALGTRRLLRGVGLMLLLRIRQPRRDFFMMTPVVGDMLPLALAAVLYAVIPGTAFAVAIPALIVLSQAAVTLDRIRPPTWLFLGASDFDSFAAFYNLRAAWGVTAVTLLDRTSDQGRAFYEAERTLRSRDGTLPRGLFYDPTVPRVWSLRTRPDMWANTVLLLIDFVPRVVVDVRQLSDYVRQELVWLAEPGRIEKAWFLAGEDGLTPALAALIPPAGHARVVSEEVLTRIAAPESGPVPPPARPDRSPTPDQR